MRHGPSFATLQVCETFGLAVRVLTDLANNEEIETRWIDAWNDLYDLIGKKSDIKCQLPDLKVVDVEECKGWLQDSAYQGYLVRVERGLILGRPGIVVSRWKDDNSERK